MVDACKRGVATAPETLEGWAHLALHSLVTTCASQIPAISKLTGRQIHKIRVGGGGSQSEHFCRGLAEASGLPVHTGPAEVTVLGNLGVQLVAQGVLEQGQLSDVLRATTGSRIYRP